MSTDPSSQTSESPSLKLTPRRPTARTAPVQESQERRFRIPLWLIVLLSLIVGGVAGGLAMRQRYINLANEVVLSINGENINKGEFYRRLELAGGASTLSQMINERLTLQYAKKNGKYPTQAEVDTQFNEAMQRPGFPEFLANSGQAPSDFKYGLRVALATANTLSQGSEASEEEIKKFYSANIDKKNPQARYYTPETIRIAVIVTRTSQQAQKALKALREGKPFRDVVEQFSEDKSKTNEGMLPVIQKGRTKVDRFPELEKAVFGMKIGEEIGPNKYAGAYWIIRCVDKKPEETLKYEQVKEECRTQVLVAKGVSKNTAAMRENFEKFRKDARIQAFWRHYSKLATKQ